MVVVTQIDRHKSVRNRCVIEVFCCVFVLSIGFEFSVGITVFIIGLDLVINILYDMVVFIRMFV